MDTMAWADVVTSISLAIGLAACAGLRAWLPLLLVGGLARAGVLSLGTSFGFLASNRALILFGVATAIEIVGDKVPAVDHALDMLSTVLRPAAGSLIAARASLASTSTGASCVLAPVSLPARSRMSRKTAAIPRRSPPCGGG